MSSLHKAQLVALKELGYILLDNPVTPNDMLKLRIEKHILIKEGRYPKKASSGGKSLVHPSIDQIKAWVAVMRREGLDDEEIPCRARLIPEAYWAKNDNKFRTVKESDLKE